MNAKYEAAYHIEGQSYAVSEMLKRREGFRIEYFPLESIHGIREAGLVWYRFNGATCMVVLADDCNPDVIMNLRFGETIYKVVGEGYVPEITFGRTDRPVALAYTGNGQIIYRSPGCGELDAARLIRNSLCHNEPKKRINRRKRHGKARRNRRK